MKKFLFIFTAVMLMLSMSLMTACGSVDLTEARQSAIDDIEAYAAKKLQEHDYPEENAAMLETFAAQGKEAVEACETQEALETALNEALYNLDSVAYTEVFGEELTGTLYNLQAAYESGLITKTDLERMAYYNNNEIEFPLELNHRVEVAIQETAAEVERNDGKREAISEEFEVTSYYGTYSGCYAIKMASIYYHYQTSYGGHWVNIGGVDFYFHYISGRIRIWKANI